MASAAGVSCEGWNTKSFFKRAGAGDITRCLEAGGDVNGRNEEGETPLHWAAKRNGKRDVMAALLKAGADPNARNEKGSTPLHWAADSESPAGLTALLKAGADPNARDVWGYTPLHRAAGFSINPALVTALIEAGADPKARNVWDSTPLHWAAQEERELRGSRRPYESRGRPESAEQAGLHASALCGHEEQEPCCSGHLLEGLDRNGLASGQAQTRVQEEEHGELRGLEHAGVFPIRDGRQDGRMP